MRRMKPNNEKHEHAMNEKKQIMKISCPTCDKPDTWKPENKFRPFCSDRCKLIDLGEWANESRKLPCESSDGIDDEEFS